MRRECCGYRKEREVLHVESLHRNCAILEKEYTSSLLVARLPEVH